MYIYTYIYIRQTLPLESETQRDALTIVPQTTQDLHGTQTDGTVPVMRSISLGVAQLQPFAAQLCLRENHENSA